MVLDAVVGFIGSPYTVFERDGNATMTIGIVRGAIDVLVTLNIHLVSGSATGISNSTYT